MTKEGKVSLWLGNFKREEDFRDFMEIKYNSYGDSIPSKFKNIFKIKYYDIDFSEIDYSTREISNLEILLEGFSNDYELIQGFKQKYQDGVYNSVVLLYDFEYEVNNIIYNNGNDMLVFIGSIEYSK